jgi:hypothetical protein
VIRFVNSSVFFGSIVDFVRAEGAGSRFDC